MFRRGYRRASRKIEHVKQSGTVAFPNQQANPGQQSNFQELIIPVVQANVSSTFRGPRVELVAILSTIAANQGLPGFSSGGIQENAGYVEATVGYRLVHLPAGQAPQSIEAGFNSFAGVSYPTERQLMLGANGLISGNRIVNPVSYSQKEDWEVENSTRTSRKMQQGDRIILILAQRPNMAGGTAAGSAVPIKMSYSFTGFVQTSP